MRLEKSDLGEFEIDARSGRVYCREPKEWQARWQALLHLEELSLKVSDGEIEAGEEKKEKRRGGTGAAMDFGSVSRWDECGLVNWTLGPG